MRKRVVIAGFGDTGLLAAIHLAKDFEVVGITPKPCLVSGQELGSRIARPHSWKENYLMPFASYKQLDGVSVLQGLIQSVDTEARSVEVACADGEKRDVPYDALLISSGVTNGFWRQSRIESLDGIHDQIDDTSERFARAARIAVIGGGASGASAAGNLAEVHPDKRIDWFFSQAQPLPGYHSKVRDRVARELAEAGVQLHPHHRAVLPADFTGAELSPGAIEWSTGQAPSEADLILWAIGKVSPNSDFLPREMLTSEGFVNADEMLRVEGFENVFTVGDIAASDANRSSARNWGYRTVSGNIRAYLRDDAAAMQPYRASTHRWGSVLGVQAKGMRVFQPDGGSFRFPRWVVTHLLFPIAVRRGIYKGMRPAPR